MASRLGLRYEAKGVTYGRQSEIGYSSRHRDLLHSRPGRLLRTSRSGAGGIHREHDSGQCHSDGQFDRTSGVHRDKRYHDADAKNCANDRATTYL